MKKLILLLSGIATLTACSTVKTEEAVNYNQFLYNSIDPVLNKMIDFEMAAFEDNPEKLQVIHKELMQTIQESEQMIEKKEAFDGNESFKKAALNIVNFYKDITETDYASIIQIAAKEIVSDDDEIKIEEIINLVYEKENSVYNSFEKEATLFSEKYGFKLESLLPDLDKD
jgi:hypothetical protein